MNILFKQLSKIFMTAFVVLSAFGCGGILDKVAREEDIRVDLTMELGGKKTEMTCPGFSASENANGTKYIDLAFANAASMLTANVLTVEVPGYKEGKSVYIVEKGEVRIEYQTDQEVFEGETGEWVAEKGTFEVTSYAGKTLKGKITATLRHGKNKSKTLELKNGQFTAESYL